MNQQEVNPASVEVSKNKEDKAARNSLIRGILAVLFVAPLAYIGAGLLYWLSRGLDVGIASVPCCLLPIALVIVSIIPSVKGMKSSRKNVATVALVLSVLAIILGIVEAIFGFIDGMQPGGII
jgi:hypothetical protein